MLKLKPVDFTDISKYFVDFQKHSKFYEMPPEQGRILGIFDYENKLIGYFILLVFKDQTVWIEQGYLTKEARHKGYPKKAMKLLEERIKKAGLKIIKLQTVSRFKSYLNFAQDLGYKPERIVFSKEVN
jgi:GNAT superfamily N-acetyltransferase